MTRGLLRDYADAALMTLSYGEARARVDALASRCTLPATAMG